MGATIEAKKAEQFGNAAIQTVNNAAARRMGTEQMLMQEEMLLGTPAQVSGTLGGGVSPAVLPYASRYQFNSAAAGSITGQQYKIDALQSGVNKANDLMAQAQVAAQSGDLTTAANLKAQADAAVMGDFTAATGSRNAIFKDPSVFGTLITQTTDPSLEAATRLNSPLAQTVGANVARGRELADPNSAARAQLTQNIVGAPVAQISQGQSAALGNIKQGTAAALGSLNSGIGKAIGEITTGEQKALLATDVGFGKALEALTVGEAKSIGEVDNGVQYALDAIAKATENALRSIEAGTQGTRRAMVDQMRQRGAAARPFEAQAVQNRAEEHFATERAVTETEKGRQSAEVQAQGAGARAGIYERVNANRANVEVTQAQQKAGIIMSAAGQRAGLDATQATTAAQLQQQAGLASAQINLQATLAKADIMSRGQQFIEEFSANFSFQSVAQAQAFLQNQAGVREQFQGAMDNLAVTAAGFQNSQANRAQQMALQMQGQDAAAEANRKDTLLQVATIAAGVGAFFIPGVGPAIGAAILTGSAGAKKA